MNAGVWNLRKVALKSPIDPAGIEQGVTRGCLLVQFLMGTGGGGGVSNCCVVLLGECGACIHHSHVCLCVCGADSPENGRLEWSASGQDRGRIYLGF